MKHLYLLSDLKSQARALRDADKTLTQSKAYEVLAHTLGLRNWNTLRAMAVDWRAQTPIRGRYLGHDFTGHIQSAEQQGAVIALTIIFDEAVDVVVSHHFTNLRKRVTVQMQSPQRSVGETSNGVPHMVMT